MPGHFPRSGLLLLAALTTVALVAAGGVATVGADPISTDQAQAAALQAQIAANNEKIDALGQQADGAQVKLDQAQQTLNATEARLRATESDLTRLRARVRQRAVSAYQSALSGEQFDSLDFSDAQRLMIAQEFTKTQASQDTALSASLNTLEQQLGQQKQAAQQATADATAAKQQIDDAKASLQTVNAQQQQALSLVQGQLVQLVAQEQAAAADGDWSAWVREFGGSDGGDPAAYPNLPPVSPQAAQALSYALQQLGKPYLYAAAGPNSFDCSGLVMAAYATAGVRLPHYSGAMYAMLPHIRFTDLQPGDLLFWGVDASEHVAFYVGDGKLLEAGGDTNEVHIGPIWGTPMGAARVP